MRNILEGIWNEEKIIRWLLKIILDDCRNYRIQIARGIYFSVIVILSVFIALKDMPDLFKGISMFIVLMPAFLLYVGSFKLLVDEINIFAHDYVDKADDEIEKQLIIGKDLLPINILAFNIFGVMVISGICYIFPNIIDTDVSLKLLTVIYTFVALSIMVVPNYLFYSISMYYVKYRK